MTWYDAYADGREVKTIGWQGRCIVDDAGMPVARVRRDEDMAIILAAPALAAAAIRLLRLSVPCEDIMLDEKEEYAAAWAALRAALPEELRP